jgi:hypothetical protein
MNKILAALISSVIAGAAFAQAPAAPAAAPVAPAAVAAPRRHGACRQNGSQG